MWQDGSPLVDYSSWYRKLRSGHEASACSRNNPVGWHWLGITPRSFNPRVNERLLYNQPNPGTTSNATTTTTTTQDERMCVGYVSTSDTRYWLTVPCTLRINTKVLCHQPLHNVPDIVNATAMAAGGYGRITCPHEWFSSNGLCIQFTSSRLPFNAEPKQASGVVCASVRDSTLNNRLRVFDQLKDTVMGSAPLHTTNSKH